jgi:hypothetical protein
MNRTCVGSIAATVQSCAIGKSGELCRCRQGGRLSAACHAKLEQHETMRMHFRARQQTGALGADSMFLSGPTIQPLLGGVASTRPAHDGRTLWENR